MNRKGTCWDNAPMAICFNNLKSERVLHCRYATCADAMADLLDYLGVFYDRKRLHSELKYQI